ncbi:unnamed protein product [Pleuronectes platessa]|uniref:Uncharacterized protein n=1 Tax=Pleuronectes platessa TaxID=8262 RepID=A0A9N7UZ49_PLEPL|nr:unnamed protein product [Pleuronectes platessa]
MKMMNEERQTSGRVDPLEQARVTFPCTHRPGSKIDGHPPSCSAPGPPTRSPLSPSLPRSVTQLSSAQHLLEAGSPGNNHPKGNKNQQQESEEEEVEESDHRSSTTRFRDVQGRGVSP